MINGINNWFSSGYPQQNPIIRKDTIVMIALGALSFLSASFFDHSTPGLSLFLRIVPVGLSFYWLFSRCCCNGLWKPGHSHYHQQVPVVVHQPAPSYWSSWSPRSYLPSWPSWPKRLWSAPVSRSAHHVPAATLVHPLPFIPIGYNTAPVIKPGFPVVQPVPSAPPYHQVMSSFPAPQVAPAQPAHHFPAVQRAPAQPGSMGLHPAPVSRNSVPASNNRQMFAAAVKRN